ncbi:MAG: hypothetical protein EZS28_038579, partial [Streblomastix strix]
MTETVAENTTQGGLKKAPYTWTQTLNDMTLEMKVPKGTPPKNLDVRITAGHLFIGLKGQPPILDADFTDQVNSTESTWELEGRENLTL